MSTDQSWDLLGNVHAAEPVLGLQVGQTVLRTHGPTECLGENCCIHNPSAHPLRDAPLNWRGDRRMMERICSHGIGHPDPDDLSFKLHSMGQEAYDRRAYGVHGCDGCCSKHIVREPKEES